MRKGRIMLAGALAAAAVAALALIGCGDDNGGRPAGFRRRDTPPPGRAGKKQRKERFMRKGRIMLAGALAAAAVAALALIGCGDDNGGTTNQTVWRLNWDGDPNVTALAYDNTRDFAVALTAVAEDAGFEADDVVWTIAGAGEAHVEFQGAGRGLAATLAFVSEPATALQVTVRASLDGETGAGFFRQVSFSVGPEVPTAHYADAWGFGREAQLRVTINVIERTGEIISVDVPVGAQDTYLNRLAEGAAGNASVATFPTNPLGWFQNNVVQNQNFRDFIVDAVASTTPTMWGLMAAGQRAANNAGVDTNWPRVFQGDAVIAPLSGTEVDANGAVVIIAEVPAIPEDLDAAPPVEGSPAVPAVLRHQRITVSILVNEDGSMVAFGTDATTNLRARTGFVTNRAPNVSGPGNNGNGLAFLTAEALPLVITAGNFDEVDLSSIVDAHFTEAVEAAFRAAGTAALAAHADFMED
jgi:hypothetical protein